MAEVELEVEEVVRVHQPEVLSMLHLPERRLPFKHFFGNVRSFLILFASLFTLYAHIYYEISGYIDIIRYC